MLFIYKKRYPTIISRVYKENSRLCKIKKKRKARLTNRNNDKNLRLSKSRVLG